MELPAYHMPQYKNIIKSCWDRSYEFLKRATTFIMATVILIWLLSSFPYGVEYASKESFIGIIGTKISFIFSLAGYGFWQASIALITGILAKEAVVSTLGTLFANSVKLEESLLEFYTPISAYSYLLMILLYTPCLSAISTFKQESGSWKLTIFLVLYTFFIALLISTIFYQIAIRFFV